MRTSAGAMRHEAQEGQFVATVRVKAQHCTSPHRSPWRWHARATVCDEQPDRPGIRGGRSPHAGDERKTEAATEAVSDHLRRQAGRHVMWVHGKVAGMGWRARFECAYHRRSRCGCCGRHLLHHLLILHSTRRLRPEIATFFLTSSSSVTSFRETGYAVAWRIASSRPLRSPIWTDG